MCIKSKSTAGGTSARFADGDGARRPGFCRLPVSRSGWRRVPDRGNRRCIASIPRRGSRQTIREAALAPHEGGRSTVATVGNDVGFTPFFKTGWTRSCLTGCGD